MKVSITGSRDFNDYEWFKNKLETFLKENNIECTLIISGGAIGIDTFAKIYSIENYIELKEFLPNWKKFGKSAGIIRNKDIIENADINLIFWDGISKGTKFNIDYCKNNNKNYFIFTI